MIGPSPQCYIPSFVEISPGQGGCERRSEVFVKTKFFFFFFFFFWGGGGGLIRGWGGGGVARFGVGG